ncbi:MAG: hypothetical protein J6W76_08650 [Spirochaetales bacterium]|nr:hypothetical protein [Spirochaetales bacterium]
MKSKTKKIFGTILTVSALVSCNNFTTAYGPAPDNTDDQTQQSQCVIQIDDTMTGESIQK